MHAAGEHALSTYGQTTLVIAADTDGDAIRLYRALGFADVERHCTLERRPRDLGLTPADRCVLLGCGT